MQVHVREDNMDNEKELLAVLKINTEKFYFTIILIKKYYSQQIKINSSYYGRRVVKKFIVTLKLKQPLY